MIWAQFAVFLYVMVIIGMFLCIAYEFWRNRL